MSKYNIQVLWFFSMILLSSSYFDILHVFEWRSKTWVCLMCHISHRAMQECVYTPGCVCDHDVGLSSLMPSHNSHSESTLPLFDQRIILLWSQQLCSSSLFCHFLSRWPTWGKGGQRDAHWILLHLPSDGCNLSLYGRITLRSHLILLLCPR